MRKLFLVLAASAAVAGPAAAADLPAGPYAKAPAMAPLYSWTGCYIGANAGGGSNREGHTEILRVDPNYDLGYQQVHGAMGGGQIGCDYQTGNWVVGAQGLFDAVGFAGSSHVVPPPGNAQFGDILDLTSKASWVATATARIGYAIQPQLLFYAKGGAAWMRSDLAFAETAMGSTDIYTGAETRTGWTAGAGLEYLIAANWSVFAEYNHMDFGSSTLNMPLANFPNLASELIQVSRKVDSAMVGFNFRLGPSGR